MALPKNEAKPAQGIRALRYTLFGIGACDTSIQREMAAEWLRLADAVIHPQKPMVSNRARRHRT
ncbi:MAG: hypothetical protein WCD69_19705 [Xanthobacteraceae bacterium]